MAKKISFRDLLPTEDKEKEKEKQSLSKEARSLFEALEDEVSPSETEPPKAAEAPQPSQDTSYMSLASVQDIINTLNTSLGAYPASFNEAIKAATILSAEKSQQAHDMLETETQAFIEDVFSQKTSERLFEKRDFFLKSFTNFHESLDFSHLINEAEESLARLKRNRDTLKDYEQRFGRNIRSIQDSLISLQAEIDAENIRLDELKMEPISEETPFSYDDLYYDFADIAHKRQENCLPNMDALKPGFSFKREHDLSKEMFKALRKWVKETMREKKWSFDQYCTHLSNYMQRKTEIEVQEQTISRLKDSRRTKNDIKYYYEQAELYIKEHSEQKIAADFATKVADFLLEQSATRSFAFDHAVDDEKKAQLTALNTQSSELLQLKDTVEKSTEKSANIARRFSDLNDRIKAILNQKRINDVEIFPAEIINDFLAPYGCVETAQKQISDTLSTQKAALDETINTYRNGLETDPDVSQKFLTLGIDQTDHLNDHIAKIEHAFMIVFRLVQTQNVTLRNSPAALQRAREFLKHS